VQGEGTLPHILSGYPTPKTGNQLKTEYVWEKAYEAAILEVDFLKLPKLLQIAKLAIDDRLHDLLLDHGGTPAERQAISDALGGLNVLRRELDIRFSNRDSAELNEGAGQL
jgi:hypothetical protein